MWRTGSWPSRSAASAVPAATPPSAGVARRSWRFAVSRALFPDPPRRIPAHRWLGVIFRTAHIASFGILLGGHVFDVPSSRLVPFLVAALATGAALMALEVASTCLWLAMGKGIAVLVKLALIALIPFFWDARVPLLLAALVIASVGAHMPSRLRHRIVLTALDVVPPSYDPTPARHEPKVDDHASTMVEALLDRRRDDPAGG